MNLLDLIALALAAHALAFAWTMKDGLFSELLDKIDVWGSYAADDFVDGVPKWRPWIKYKIARGLQCRTCITYHAAFWLGVIFMAPGFFCSEQMAAFIKLPVYTLAATRIAISCFENEEQ